MLKLIVLVILAGLMLSSRDSNLFWFYAVLYSGLLAYATNGNVDFGEDSEEENEQEQIEANENRWRAIVEKSDRDTPEF